MAALVRRRRDRLRGRRGAWSRLRLLAVVGAPLAVLAAAPVALARPAVPRPALGLAGLVPVAAPSVCVGGVLLCPGSVVTLPTPTPVPTACVPGAVCSGDIVGPASPPGGATPPATAPPRGRPTASAPAGSPGGGGPSPRVVAAGSLPAPPGVGIVVPPAGPAADGGLSPDSFASLLSLSLRDGLASAQYHVWPWLMGMQLAAWTAIALVAWSRQLANRRRP